jgi:ABC transport system ATP-binding/permease protein
MWVLKTADAAETPFTFRILPGSIKTIGRAPRADFIVDAALVSRLHCRLTAGANDLEVVDLDSTNGTFVNGERTSRALLKHGDRLGVGRVELIVDLMNA